MGDWLRFFERLRGQWRLRGHDTFAGEDYPLPGRFRSEASAQRAARRHLPRLERTQPSVTSGGQTGIQDRVSIVRPDGTAYRYGAKDH